MTADVTTQDKDWQLKEVLRDIAFNTKIYRTHRAMIVFQTFMCLFIWHRVYQLFGTNLYFPWFEWWLAITLNLAYILLNRNCYKEYKKARDKVVVLTMEL